MDTNTTNIKVDKNMPLEPNMIKDHDLLVRLDEKVDNIGRVLEALNKSLDARGQAIDDLKTQNLLHLQETKSQWKRIDDLNSRVTSLENSVDTNNTIIETKNKTIDDKILILEQSSITLWMQKHPKAAWTIIVVIVLFINFHDVFTPYILSVLGIKLP